MTPQMTYLLAVDHARDIRRDVENRTRAATPSTTSDQRSVSLQLPATGGRPSLLRRLRLA